MWRLEQIHAKNFSAFKELDYSPLQSHATLIFGNNMDNDSQKSNGSGKSALIEAIAVGLTGATLRNIKTEEIINDNADEAVVSLKMTNEFLRQDVTIQRTLSRKNPQVVKVWMMDYCTLNGGIATPTEIAQASVAEYNKYILDMLGLSKDDIYANFILCKHKYQSFLSSSDKDKKEIINRFSNGILVDESIAALEADMEPVIAELSEAEKIVANYTGRVSAITDQIEEALAESANRSKDKAERIQGWKDAIAEKRNKIREYLASQRDTEDKIEAYNAMIEKLNDAEGKQNGIEEAYGEIMNIFVPNEITLDKDYQGELDRLDKQLDSLTNLSAQKVKASKEAADNVARLKKVYDKLQDEYDKFHKEYDVELPKVNDTIQKLLTTVRSLEAEVKEKKTLRIDIENRISDLRKLLLGVVTCPKCKHEFLVSKEDVNVAEVKKELTELQDEYDDNEKLIRSTQTDIEQFTQKGREARTSQTEWETKLTEWSGKLSSGKINVNKANQAMSDAKAEYDEINAKISKIGNDIDNLRTKMFDDAFKIVESSLDSFDAKIDALERDINNANGAIRSYEESIKEIDKANENDLIDNLKASKAKYEEGLGDAKKKQSEIEIRLNEFKTQIAIFTEFKTHLANSKIEALSHITNEFLEAIGSDIRIAFSGFTVLKSGKIRDKISISLLRDGINCGSFDKFSEGEKARVNLANILAMHKLTNVSCSEGKGLDLLILDEILDATDETGLANIFQSLNSFQITSLVVSHGNIAENYPYKLVVNKQNGVSFI